VPAFAGPGSTITNKEDCEKTGKVWDDAGKKMRGEAVSDGRRLPAPLCFVQPMSELCVAFLEGFGELCSPRCPRQAAEPPFLEAPAGVKSGASSI
jgi:hypothetical protein